MQAHWEVDLLAAVGAPASSARRRWPHCPPAGTHALAPIRDMAFVFRFLVQVDFMKYDRTEDKNHVNHRGFQMG